MLSTFRGTAVAATAVSALLLASTQVSPVVAAASSGGEAVTATWTNESVSVIENGVVLNVVPLDDSDPTLIESTGVTLDGTTFTVQEYRMLDPGDPPADPGAYSDPNAIIYEDDSAEESFSEDSQVGSPYGDSDLIKVAAVVTLPSKAIILKGGIEGEPGTIPGPSDPTVVISSSGDQLGQMSADGSFTDETDMAQGEERTYTLSSQEAETSVVATLNEPQSTYRNSRMLFDYRTFIPNYRVSVNQTACRGTFPSKTIYFGGDNRTYRAPSSSKDYRTRTQVEANWSHGRVYFRKWVQPTKEYSSSTSTSPVRSATASSSNIYMHSVKRTTKSASFKVWHSSGNPLCRFGGSIWYGVTGTMWRNGSASFHGYRVKVPRHEMYVLGNDKYVWYTVQRRETREFSCLVFATCGEDSWSKSFTRNI